MNIVIAYDVSDDRQRFRLAALLSRYGVRLQRSVFECELDEAALAGLLEQAGEIVELNHDIVHAFTQCATCLQARKGLGQAPIGLREDYWIV